MPHFSMNGFSLIGIFFCISTSFPKKEKHGRYIFSFSLLPCPLLPRGEVVTFLIKDTRKKNRIDTRKKNRVGVYGRLGDVVLGSSFKNQVAIQLQ